ncbi:hypothetical protein Agabi119p4_3888 [Agaricus bisporus var. burnettii]|uniref:Uncharacterized protein n=1 Tax=Agaricus bisporus var. burnettii TaxID=192524 RepID=A0A8H7KI44_AGABI|nr:hypothetical protein Agabi119p4_3888 [Agaricus bisporus var. burnettii]
MLVGQRLSGSRRKSEMVARELSGGFGLDSRQILYPKSKISQALSIGWRELNAAPGTGWAFPAILSFVGSFPPNTTETDYGYSFRGSTIIIIHNAIVKGRQALFATLTQHSPIYFRHNLSGSANKSIFLTRAIDITANSLLVILIHECHNRYAFECNPGYYGVMYPPGAINPPSTPTDCSQVFILRLSARVVFPGVSSKTSRRSCI